MKFFIIIFCLIYSFHSANGQSLTADDSTRKEGKIRIIKDSKIDTLLSRQNVINQDKQTMAGYRIQIYFGSDRSTAYFVKTEFLQKYPDIQVYLLYQHPNFKIRAGDFRTRMEAHKLYLQLLGQFETVFIVPDEISFPEL